MENSIEIKKRRFFSSENIMGTLTVLMIFAVPLLFSFSSDFGFSFLKVLPVFAVAIAGLVFILLKIFKEGRYKIIYHPIFFVGAFLSLVYVVSGLFSSNISKAFWGSGFETGTVSFTMMLFVLVVTVATFLRSKSKVFLSYFAFTASFTVVAIYHILRFIFGANFLSMGIFTNLVSNTIGSFGELGIFSGIALLLSLISIEFLPLSKRLKVFSYVVLALSVIMVALSNFLIINEAHFKVSLFTIIGLFSLVFFVYFLASSYGQSNRRIPFASLIVLIVSVIFTFGFNEINHFVANKFKINNTEIRPTLAMTGVVSFESLKQKPLLGYGPNHFVESWTKNKPSDVLRTDLWDKNFVYGSGNIVSTLVSVGPIGFVSWLLLLGIFVILGIKTIFLKNKDIFSHYILVSSFLISLYLWIVNVIYPPGIVLLVLTFTFTAIYIGALVREGLIVEKTFVFEDSREKTFGTIMGLVVVMVVIIFWTFTVGQKFTASYFANKGYQAYKNAQNKDDLNKSELYINQSLRLSINDDVLRLLANVALAKVQLLLNDKTSSQEDLRLQFKNTYQMAVNAAANAANVDKNNYQNYMAEGNVSQFVLPLGVAGAYDSAKSAYNQAIKLNPKDPSIYLSLARLEMDNKNTDEAVNYIKQALQMKGDYAAAFILLAQIQANKGDTGAAIDTLVSGASVVADTNLYFNLGLLKYNSKAYTDAVSAFEKSVILSPYYANAKYFLALSYYNSNRTDEALVQLQDVKILNPNNAEVDTLINNIKSGQTSIQTEQTISATSTATSTKAKTTVKK